MKKQVLFAYFSKCLFIFSFFFINFSFSQNKDMTIKQIDSALNVLKFDTKLSNKQCLEKARNLLEISTKKKYKIGQSLALIRIAKFEGNLSFYKQALIDVEKAKVIANEIDNDSLKLFADFIKSVQIGRSGFNEKAVKMIDECFDRSECLSNDSKNGFLGVCYSFKAIFSVGLNPPPSYKQLLDYHKKSAYYHSLILKKKSVNTAYVNVGVYFDLLGQIDSAIYYQKKALLDYKKVNLSTPEAVYTNLAGLYIKKRNFDSALKFLDSSNVIAKKGKIYYHLGINYAYYKDIYLKKNNKELADEYHKLELIYKDSAKIAEMNSTREAANYVVEKSEKDFLDKLSVTFKIIIIILFASLIIAIIAFIQYKKNLKSKSIVEQKEQVLQEKDSTIVDLKQKIVTSFDEVIEMAKKDHPLFVNFFKELYPEFYEKLMKVQPDLTITEQKVCFYLKLKFSTKEIAEYTFVTTKAIQNRKNRLRKRLNLKEGDDLYLWIESL